ncbi:MAG: MliC family protein [Aquimonas sp.]|nr:MliC family protein [Aquimonas sp.]
MPKFHPHAQLGATGLLPAAVSAVLLAACASATVNAPADTDPAWIPLHCEQRSFSVAYQEEQAWLREGARKSPLAQARAASGARYSGRHGDFAVELWEKGGQVQLNLGGDALACVHPEQLPWRKLVCGEATWQVAFAPQRAWLRSGDTLASLQRVSSEWGTRYAGPWLSDSVDLWHQGRTVSLRLGASEAIHCDDSADYSAQGNEPFWRIEQHGEVFELDQLGAPGLWAGSLIELRSEPGMTRIDAQGTAAGDLLRLVLAPGVCRDSMSGMPFPDSVRVEFQGETLQGCGGLPERLLTTGAWQPESVPALARAQLLRFEEAGQLAFEGRCNLHRGRWQLSGEGLQLSFTSSTLRACDDATEAEDRRRLAALTATVRHGFDTDGALLLYAGDDSVLRLRVAAGD